MTKILMMMLAALMFSGCQTLRPSQGSAPARAGIFEFHNSFWVNLHHYLYEQAGEEKPDITWAQGERESVSAALKYYRETYTQRDLLMDAELRDIKDQLVRAGDAGDLSHQKIAADLRMHLEKVSVVYRNQLWAKHSAANEAWIAAARELTVKYAPAIQRELEKVLQRNYEDAFYRIDVAYVANWAGAYTTLPAHTVIASSAKGNADFASLEVLYHEVTHTRPFRLIEEELTMALAKKEKKDPGQLAHALMFYTVGETVKRTLAASGTPYVPYAEKRGLFGPGRDWEKLLPIFVEYWTPYLDDKTDLRDSVRAVVEHLPN